jgi:hypothetical protein
MMMYLLGMGSSTYPLPPSAWDAWKRITFEYDGLRYIGSYAPLFVHQYSQAWFDFRGKHNPLCGLFPELDDRDGSAPPVLHRTGQAVSRKA